MKQPRVYLRAKILFLLMSSLSVIIVISALWSFYLQRRELLRDRNRHAAVSVERLAHSMSLPILDNDREQLEKLAREELKEDGTLRVVVQDVTGRMLLFMDKKGGYERIPGRSSILAGNIYPVRHEIFKGLESLGTLEIVYDSAHIHDKLFNMLVLGTVQALLLILVSCLALYVGLSRILLEPLDSLHKAAVALGAGSLSGRIEVTSQDELGELSEAFNRMSEAVEDKLTRLQDSISEVRQLEGTLSDIVDSLPSIIAVVDHGGQVDLWNAKAEEYSGVTSSDARGKRFEDLLPQFAGQLRQIVEIIELHAPCRTERIQLGHGSERRYYDMQLCSLTSEGVGRAVIRIDDITEQVRIEDMMVQTEKMMMVGGLAAGMAHEINNPLGAIMQNAQNIERRISEGIEANHAAALEVGIQLDVVRAYLEKRGILGFISHIREAGSRASKIITGMLHFSRKSESRVESADLAMVIDRTLELAANDYDMKKSYDFKHFKVVREYAPDLPPVAITVLEIEQVLLNIIKNAAQAIAGDAGGREPLLTLRTRRVGELAVIEVEDNGPGMEEGIRHRIFEPFFTTKDVGVGTGLGLSVSYAIVTKNHLGSIEVASQPGEGARFVIQLPIKGRMA